MSTARTTLRAWRRVAIAIAVASISMGLIPAGASAAPAGGFASDYSQSDISQFTFGTNMTLAPNGRLATGSEPWFVSVTPDAKFLYSADFGDGTVSQYSVSSTGTLTPLSTPTVTSDSTFGSSAEPVQVAISPDGQNAYVANAHGSVTVFDIGSGGTLSRIQRITGGLTSAVSVAVSPDGTSVYVADDSTNSIFEYNRASDGTLTPKSTPSIPSAGSSYSGLAITPNGKYLYESDEGGITISEFSIGSGGQLAPLPVPTVVSGSDSYTIVVSPNGKNAYTDSCSGAGVSQYTIGSDGELTPMTPASVSTDACGLPWMTADGASFYVPDFTPNISQFDVSSTGALSPKSPATATDSGASTLWGFVIPPDQGPVARFSSKVKGKTVSLNASKSSDSDGTVASYHWNFGDGHSLTTSKAKVSHTYKKGAKHKVTLTVTDDSGCSTSFVFTGQTAYCNGSKAARTSHTVKVAAVKSLRLRVTPTRAKAGQRTCYAFRATSGGHGVKGATIKLAGRSAHTGGSGAATLCLALKKGTYSARASKAGYRTAAARIRVSAASPVFTG